MRFFISTDFHQKKPDLLVVDGKPAIAYYTAFGDQDLRYLYSQDADGVNWNTPVLLDDGSAAMGNMLSMAVIDGNPAISYQDHTNADLKYIRADYTHGLPVELTFFRGEMTEQGVELTWQTASEEINEGFEVQRSIDGENWEALDFTMTQLKETSVKIYPTIVQNDLTIEGGQGQVIIYNTLGQPVTPIMQYENKTTISLNQLPKGQYFLRIFPKNGEQTAVTSFMKID